MEESRCLNCRRPIKKRTYGSENWEPDFDPSDDPVTWRHANGYAACVSRTLWATPGPEIVVLCGSSKFYEAFQQANYELTMQGLIVLTVGFYPHATQITGHGEGVGHDSEEKVKLDELHKRKIDLADRVHVLNVDKYIGSSTQSEIEYAREQNKPITYLVDADAGVQMEGCFP